MGRPVREPGLWQRLVDVFHARDSAVPAPPPAASPEPAPPRRKVYAGEETWLYMPPTIPAGYQQIKVCRSDGYDFARLVWQACAECELGLIAKIRVTGPWQRHGYGLRMLRRALRGCETYTWTTTPQSEFGRAFFPAMTAVTSVAFPAQAHICEHMRAKEKMAGPAQIESSPPR